MKLLESYSHYVGIFPSKPFIDESFYPVPFDKYVIVQAAAGMPSKQYDLWDEVIENIKLPTVLVGGKDDPALPVSLDLRGKTSWRQTASLIKNSALFLGNDSVGNHMASAFGTPRIALFGATSPLTCGGYWNRDKGVELTPIDMKGCHAACHTPQCIKSEKCINSISVETVLNHIKRFLGEESVSLTKTLHKGALSKQLIVEWVPKTINQATFDLFQKIGGILSVRLDLVDVNLDDFSNVCNSINFKSLIICRPEQAKHLKVHPSKLEQLFILVESSKIADAIPLLSEISKTYVPRLISREEHAAFNSYKMELLNYPPIARLSDFDYNDTHKALIGKAFNANTLRKVVGADGKLFFTIYDALADKNPVELTSNNGNIILEEGHLKELQFLTIKENHV